MKLALHAALLLLFCAMTGGATAAEHKVASAADIAKLTLQLQPGDHVILADGTWTDQPIRFEGKGTADKPITLRAEAPGKVTLTGKSSIIIDGERLVVSGLLFKEAGAESGDTVEIKGRYNRLTDTAIIACNHKFFVHLRGTEHRVDHCYLADKANGDPTMQIEVEAQPNHHRIDHNHFGYRPPLGRNGGETIRVGYSHQSMSSSKTIVEHNLFDRCDGEIEIISNKSCDNVYRFNTFLDCAGMFTLRHGNRCLVEGNFIIGNQKKGSGGIRIIGEEHTIINNYIEGVEKGGFWITSGIPSSELKGYFQSKNCLIAFNTFVESAGPAIDVAAGLGSSRRTLRPENITIANNILVPSKGALIKGTEGEGFKWMGNFAPATSDDNVPKGIALADLKLSKEKDGVWRPSASSPVRGAARGEFAAIRIDIDGQKRVAPVDAGCDQLSQDPVTNRPLKPADVGPAWMDAEARAGGK